MSIAGIESELKWVKNKLRKLGDSIEECLDETKFDLRNDFLELENAIEDLENQCIDTITSVQDL